MEKIFIRSEVQTLILSLGLNNRKQQIQTAIKEVQRLHKMAQIKFPNCLPNQIQQKSPTGRKGLNPGTKQIHSYMGLQ